MIIASNKYADWDLDMLANLPINLKVKLEEVSRISYAELYESVSQESTFLLFLVLKEGAIYLTGGC